MLVSIEETYTGTTDCMAGIATTQLSQYELSPKTRYPSFKSVWEIWNFTYTQNGALYQFQATVYNVVSPAPKSIGCMAPLDQICNGGSIGGSIPLTNCIFQVGFRFMVSESVPVEFEPSLITADVSVTVSLDTGLTQCFVAGCSDTMNELDLPDSKKRYLGNNCVPIDFWYMINPHSEMTLSTSFSFWATLFWENKSYNFTCSANQNTLGQSSGCLLAPIFNKAVEGCKYSITMEVTNAKFKSLSTNQIIPNNNSNNTTSGSQCTISHSVVVTLLCFMITFIQTWI
jgi:hypothetical protein